MIIKELFLKDPTRWFEPVIKVDEIERERLGRDLDDYVITDEIREYLTNILDEFLESQRAQPDWVCAWISGYFGCGKTHFLKTLAAILGNLPIKPPESNNLVSTLDYFGKKWDLPYIEHLKKEFKVKPVLINLLYTKTLETPSLCEIIYRGFMVECGFASEPWVAELERQIKLDGLYENFKKKVKELEGKSWEELRQMPLYTRSIMAKALFIIAKEKFPDEQAAFKAIEDQQKAMKSALNPDWLAKRLKEEAETLDPQNGRIVLLLDEVGLYVGDGHDRLMELQALAETISKQNGKVWLIVTSQEALEEKIPEIAKVETEFQKLKDRFRMKITLTPKNISTVVQKRLLEKNPVSQAFSQLKEKFSEKAGSLAEAAMLKGVTREIDLYTRPPDEQDFLRYYPFLPFHLDLTQKALGELRGKGYGAEGLTGRERTMLGLAQKSILGLLDKPIGMLMTFDRIFDAIKEELGALRGEDIARIEELIELEQKENLPVQKVAKTLYLLQQLGEWVPTTLENIASVLYEGMNANYPQILQNVKQSLEILKRANYLSEKEGKFRFLTGPEILFEKEIHVVKIPSVDKIKLIREILIELLREFQKIRYKDIRDIEIKIQIDDYIFTHKGCVTLKVYSPLNPLESSQHLEMETAKEKEKLYLLLPPETEFIEKITYCLSLQKVIDDRKKKGLSDDERKLLKEKEAELDYLKHDELPKECAKLLSKANLIFAGQSITLSGKEWKKELKQAIYKCIEEICYEFDIAAVKLKEENITKILTWKGEPLPSIYSELDIVDNEQNIREESPFLSAILSEVKARTQRNDPNRTGKDLMEHFTLPPYCWDEKVIRLALASLLRRGSVCVKSEGKTYLGEEFGVTEIFKNIKRFRNALFDIGVSLSHEDEEKASSLLAEFFGVYDCNTPTEIWQAIKEKLSEVEQKAKMLSQRLRDLGLGGEKYLLELTYLCKDILKTISVELGIKEFILNEDNFKKHHDFYKKLLKLHTERQLEQAAKIKNQAGQLVDKSVQGEILKLLHSESFVHSWEELKGKFEDEIKKTKSAYIKLHENLKKLSEEALSFIRNHKAFIIKEAEAKAILEKFPIPFACDVKDIEFQEDLKCKNCKFSYSELLGLKVKINQWKEKILKELEVLLIPEGHLNSFKEEIEIKNLSEFSRLELKLKAFVEKAIKSGKTLKGKIIIEVE